MGPVSRQTICRVFGEFVEPVGESVATWRTKPPFGLRRSIRARYEASKRRFLRFILGTPARLFLDYSEDPVADGLADGWKRVSFHHWLVPASTDYRGLYTWLYLGNWVLYAARTPAGDDAIDAMSRGVPEAVQKAMASCGAVCVIHAFHDNDPWTISVRNDLTGQGAGGTPR